MELSLEELHHYDGKSNEKILISLLGVLYDCTAGGADFFGEGGPYKAFAGRDASYALAMMSAQSPTRDHTLQHW